MIFFEKFTLFIIKEQNIPNYLSIYIKIMWFKKQLKFKCAKYVQVLNSLAKKTNMYHIIKNLNIEQERDMKFRRLSLFDKRFNWI